MRGAKESTPPDSRARHHATVMSSCRNGTREPSNSLLLRKDLALRAAIGRGEGGGLIDRIRREAFELVGEDVARRGRLAGR